MARLRPCALAMLQARSACESASSADCTRLSITDAPMLQLMLKLLPSCRKV